MSERPTRSGRRYLDRGVSWLPTLWVSLAAVVLALLIGAVLIILGDDQVRAQWSYVFSYPSDALSSSARIVWDSYSALVVGSLGSWSAITDTLERAAPLICGGLGVSLAFRAGLFNIGAQGQLIAGAILAGYVGFSWHLPVVVHLVIALVAAVLGGAVWGGVAGVLKARSGAHEVITTIMLNYVALYGLTWALTYNAFQVPGSNDPKSPVVNATARIPSVAGLHLGILLALLAAVGVWWLLERSKLGFELRAVGANPNAARTAGMSVAKAYTLAMVIAGGLAGLAAAQQVLGHLDPLTNGIAGTIGFDSITVALLGRATPLGTVLAGLLFGVLSAGGLQMQIATQTPLTLSTVLQALIVLFVAAPALVRAIFRIPVLDSGAFTAKGWNG
jgi:general nucleoside transport system permease protein